MAATAYDALVEARSRDSARPAITFYDDASDERMELSVASLDNAVAKVANLLRDGLGLQPGDSAVLRLPLHWQLPGVALGCWAAGLVLTDAPERASVAFADIERVTAVSGADEVLAVSLEPFGMPVRGPLPPGTADLATEARVHADRFAAPAPRPDDPAIIDDAGRARSHAEIWQEAMATAGSLGLRDGGRLLVEEGSAVPPLLAAAVIPMAMAASVVLVRHPDPGRRDERIARERITAVAVR